MDNKKTYDKKKLLLAFEYGVILSEAAKNLNRELSPNIVKNMEEIIFKEFHKKTASKLSVEMQLNILAAFETKSSKK